MASFRKLKSGKWRAEVCCKGVRRSASFFKKASAQAWAAQLESSIYDGSYKCVSGANKTFGDLLLEYEQRVSAKKKGWKKESVRIQRFVRDDPICKILVADLTTNDFALWRDQRLTEVSASTVNRELNLLSHALNIAKNEWGWIADSPLKGLRRPAPAEHRSRLISADEIERFLFVCGFDEEFFEDSIQTRVAIAFLFAIETAMRAGEIVALTWDFVYFDRRVCFLPDSKTGRSREVPLSERAIELLKLLSKNKKNCFNLTSSQLDSHFRKCREKANISDLHFHDTRHEAITRLSRKVNVLQLARIVGIRDLKILMVYYNESVDDIAKNL